MRDLAQHFESNPNIEIEDLLAASRELVRTYLSTAAYERAKEGGPEHGFPIGQAWTSPASTVDSSAPSSTPDSQVPDKDAQMNVDHDPPAKPDFRGDQVLANTILRMRDSLMHYEFQFAVAGGDIGRAMNIMAVRFYNSIANIDTHGNTFRYGHLPSKAQERASIPTSCLN